ncbi:MAG: DUF4331 family protein [Actinomycetota bacterium]
MADHLDAPGLMSPGMDASIDITDNYAFQKPGDPNKTILMMNVNPLAPTLASAFNTDAVYQINVDNNGDAKTDVSFRIRFTDNEGGGQTATVRRQTGTNALNVGSGGHVVINNAPVSFGSDALVTTAFPFRFFAGIRSDPFFFDLLGFLNGFQFTGSDFFLDRNVFAIVLEVPNSSLGSDPNVGIWSRCIQPVSGKKTQIDRMGRPAINTVFNHGDDKNIFNSLTPDKDRTTFETSFVATLESFGHSASEATAIAEILLPDLLTYDFSNAGGFLNGRNLTDDVIDIALNLVTNGAVTGDGASHHTDLLPDFPYQGNPH